MIERSGKVIFGNGARVTGRLWRADSVDTDTSDMAKILVWDGISSLRTTLDSTTVGIVALTDTQSIPKCLFDGLPILCLSDCDKNTEILPTGKIAILDCQRGRLCINPDIDVIRSYFEEVSLGANNKTPWICTDSETSVAGCDGIRIKVFGSEDEVYELLCDVADKNTGARIIAQTEFGDGIIDVIKGIYRAAVWGRISMLCRARTSAEADGFFSATHSAFCALENSGREFNGFIPRGILITTPIMILSEPNRFADFFVADCNALIKGFCQTDTPDNMVGTVFSYISAYMRRAADVSTSLLCCGETARRAAEYFKSSRQLSEIYTDKKTWSELFPFV